MGRRLWRRFRWFRWRWAVRRNYRKTQSVVTQMPGVPPDQNIRRKEKTINLVEGELGINEVEVIPLCHAGHAIRHVSEIRGRCSCGNEVCQSCEELICERDGRLLCRGCAFVHGDRVLCNSHNFFIKLALALESPASAPAERQPSRRLPQPRDPNDRR